MTLLCPVRYRGFDFDGVQLFLMFLFSLGLVRYTLRTSDRDQAERGLNVGAVLEISRQLNVIIVWR